MLWSRNRIIDGYGYGDLPELVITDDESDDNDHDDGGSSSMTGRIVLDYGGGSSSRTGRIVLKDG